MRGRKPYNAFVLYFIFLLPVIQILWFFMWGTYEFSLHYYGQRNQPGIIGCITTGSSIMCQTANYIFLFIPSLFALIITIIYRRVKLILFTGISLIVLLLFIFGMFFLYSAFS